MKKCNCMLICLSPECENVYIGNDRPMIFSVLYVDCLLSLMSGKLFRFITYGVLDGGVGDGGTGIDM